MVKHPKYQAMDSAREELIPILVKEKISENPDLLLIETPPNYNPEIDGPIPRASFTVKNKKTGKLVATFHPYGHNSCKDESFQDDFDDIVKRLQNAADEALKEFEMHGL